MSAKTALGAALVAACLASSPGSARRASRDPCLRADAPARCHRPNAPAIATKSPAIESSGVSPSVDQTVPLLKRGNFRLDIATFAAIHLGDAGALRDATVLTPVTLAYGASDRLTLFAAALVADAVHRDERGMDYVDPRFGALYRLVRPGQARGVAVDAVADGAANDPMNVAAARDKETLASVGATGRFRLLFTREFAHGFTLQAAGGLQAAEVALATSRTTALNGLLGLSGQYRIPTLSERFYVNGSLEYTRPLTPDVGREVPSPFRTNTGASVTLGGTYVVDPGHVLARLTDTFAYAPDGGDDQPDHGRAYNFNKPPRRFVDTVGLTLSFCGTAPGFLGRGLF